MDDKTLDSFLESSMQNNLQPSDNAKSSENEIPQRPKLRKIKRAKPRVVPDIPQAPQKENVEQEPSRDAVIDFLSSENLNNKVLILLLIDLMLMLMLIITQLYLQIL